MRTVWKRRSIQDIHNESTLLRQNYIKVYEKCIVSDRAEKMLKSNLNLKEIVRSLITYTAYQVDSDDLPNWARKVARDPQKNFKLITNDVRIYVDPRLGPYVAIDVVDPSKTG